MEADHGAAAAAEVRKQRLRAADQEVGLVVQANRADFSGDRQIHILDHVVAAAMRTDDSLSGLLANTGRGIPFIIVWIHRRTGGSAVSFVLL
jgi:hypothetical protein